MSLEIQLDSKILKSLGNMVSVKQSMISPFNKGGDIELTASEKDALNKSGVLDGTGKIVDNVNSSIEALATANAYGRVQFTSGLELFENISYFSKEGHAVAITNSKDGLILQDPAPTAEIIDGLKQYTGESLVKKCELNIEISAEETLALAGIIDLYRKSFLSAIANEKELVLETYRIDDIYNAIVNCKEDTQWLAYVMKRMTGISEITTEMIKKALENLIISELVISDNKGYKAGEKTATLANAILIVNQLLTMDAGREADNGEVVKVGFTCLQAGLHEILSIDANGDQIRLEMISSAEMIEYVTHFMMDADALKEIAGVSNKICSNCKNILKDKAKFCPSCGTPVLAPNCKMCGAALTPDSKFCGNCGTSVNN